MTSASIRRATFRALVATSAALAACDAAPSTPTPPSAEDVASFRFVDVGASSGVDFVGRAPANPRFIPEVKGAGVAVFDQDGDGVLDFVVAAGSDVDREIRGEPGYGAAFYKGLGGLRFVDRTREVGLDVPHPWTTAPVAADADGDGRVDLLFSSLRGLRLFKNDGAKFVDVSAAAIPESARDAAGWCTSAAFADFDGDGDLDLFVCRYLRFDFARPPLDGEEGRSCKRRGKPVLCGPRGLDATTDLALRNRGDGTFEDVSAEWGVSKIEPAYGLGVTILDVDRDGRLDVFVANDATPNHVWRRVDGGFVECGAALGLAWSADGAPEAGMGVDVADLNGDGVEDVYVTNFENEPNDVYLSSGAAGWFESSARARTAAVDRPRLGFGVGIRDFDGDGFLDVFVANGHVYPDDEAALWRQPATLHLGRGGGTFSRAEGAAVAALEVPRPSRAAAFADFDDDGDADVILTGVDVRPTILRCDVPKNRPWIGVDVRGPAPNPFAVGAEVRVRYDGIERVSRVRPQASYLSTNDARIVFRTATEPKTPIEVVVVLGELRATTTARTGAYTKVRLADAPK